MGRVVIDDVRPRTPSGYPAKAVVGEQTRISADVFRDGHDVLACRVRWRPSRSRKWAEVAMAAVGNDRYETVVEPTGVGAHEFVVEAWTDRFATWRHKTMVKIEAGQPIGVEVAEGVLLLERATDLVARKDRQMVLDALTALRDGDGADHDRVFLALHGALGDLLWGPGLSDDLTTSASFALWVDRERALAGAWYELFPRSHGGLAGTADRLPAVADMGFDVVYLPPIHPIGRSHRKGPDNTLEAGPDDVGSPWAIGGPEGGHTEVHPDLGTIDDFDALVKRAGDLGLEIALDYALQCSPDHPWVQKHPEWFHRRPDGSIAYAENPPKKYQDIYPINFWPADESDRAALWSECKAVLDHWIGHGVRIFRVDNPHTKPLAFWEWVIPAVQRDNPDVIFLAEAFTAPKMMAKLAEVGFSQSYTYFTWRTTGADLREYVLELADGPTTDFMRPNFWPNTPDILSGPLRNGSAAQFRCRLVLAATLSPSYGIYSGYELCENEPQSETNEEYRSSEKFEVRHRDFDQPHSLAPLIADLNGIRRRHPALERLRGITFHHSDNDRILAYSRRVGDDTVIVAVNLDPDSTHETVLHLDMAALGLGWEDGFEALDELRGEAYPWHAHPFVRLGPELPAHIIAVGAHR